MNRYILNTNDKNSYGYKVLTDGIDLTDFIQNPVMLYNHSVDEVLGKWTDIRKEDDITLGRVLTAMPEFCDDDDTLDIKNKIEKGYIIGCSIGATVLDAIVDENNELIVTKSSLVEASITALPSNKKAKIKNNFQLSELSIELNFNGEKDINKIKEHFMNKPIENNIEPVIELTTFNNHPDIKKEEVIVEEPVIETTIVEEVIEEPVIAETIIEEPIVEELPKSKKSKKVDELKLSETLVKNLNLTINEDEYIDSKIILTVVDLYKNANKTINDYPEYITLTKELNDSKLHLENLMNELNEVKASIKNKEVSAIVEDAVKEGKIKAEQKELIVELAQNNIDTLKKLIDSINVVKTPEISLTQLIKTDINTNSVNKDWKWYQKNDPTGLKELKLNNKPMFNKLYFDEYKVEYK